MIYVCSIQEGQWVKIGYHAGDDANDRIAALQTGSPYLISLEFMVDGTLLQEQTLHALLRDAFTRIRVPMPPNEWYPGRPPFMVDFLGWLRLGVQPAVTKAESMSLRAKHGGASHPPIVAPNLRWACGTRLLTGAVGDRPQVAIFGKKRRRLAQAEPVP